MKIRLVCSLLALAPCVYLSSFSGSALAQEFTRSTIPLKTGGSITSIDSQGRNATYLNRDARTQTGQFARTADARTSAAYQSGVSQRETGFAQDAGSSSANSGSFYRAQQNAGDNSSYPYPARANTNSGIQPGGGVGVFSNASAAGDGQATLRFDRSGLGERPSGSLGETNSAANGNRVAQLPQPPTTLPITLPSPAICIASNTAGRWSRTI